MIALICDTETSGLVQNHVIPLARQPSIIEYFGWTADFNRNELLDPEPGQQALDLLIKPPKPIDAEITKITGLTNEMLEAAPPFAAVADLIKMQIEAAPVVIAHNLSFDKEMIDLEFERLGQKINWPRVICTVECCNFLKGYRLSLSNLHEHLFGESFAGGHRAKNDVAALTRCCQKLFEMGVL